MSVSSTPGDVATAAAAYNKSINIVFFSLDLSTFIVYNVFAYICRYLFVFVAGVHAARRASVLHSHVAACNLFKNAQRSFWCITVTFSWHCFLLCDFAACPGPFVEKHPS